MVSQEYIDFLIPWFDGKTRNQISNRKSYLKRTKQNFELLHFKIAHIITEYQNTSD